MVHASLQKPVSTLDAILSSISIDRQVYLWFSHLLDHPEIKSSLSSITEARRFYDKIRHWARQQRILYVLFLCLMAYSIVTRNIIAPGFGILFLYPFIKLHLLKKKYIVDISRHFLLQEFAPEEIPQKTLYQIAEICAKKYSLPSLVDFITSMDKHCRRAIIAAFIFTCFLYPSDQWIVVFASPILAYFATSLLAGTNIYFRKFVQ